MDEGFLYFIGRRDEMMKTSGYRVSPTEVEEILYATKMVGECVAFGVDDDRLGQAIQVIAHPRSAVSWMSPPCPNAGRMPAYMVPPASTFAKAPTAQSEWQDRPEDPVHGLGRTKQSINAASPYNTMSTSRPPPRFMPP